MVVQTPPDDRGPVLVTVEYQVDPQDTERFIEAMQRLRLQRHANRRVQWGLFNDTADPTRFVETFLSESWAEHMRQHARVTMEIAKIEEAVDAFHLGPEKPTVRHLVHIDLKSIHGLVPQP